MIAAVFMPGCEHNELCYDHTHVTELNVEFDWSQAPDADPSTMVVHFFRPDGSLYRRVEFTQRTGGKVRLEAGEYRILFHNGNMETVYELGNSHSDYALSGVSRSILEPMGREGDAPRPPESADQLIFSAPDQVWAGSHSAIEILPGVAGQTVKLTPVEATMEYTVEITGVENLRDDIDVSAAITGMSPLYRLAEGCHGGEAATLPISVERVGDNTLVAHFRTFGHCPQTELAHTFSVYTSNKFFVNYDITEKMHNAPDPRHVVIEIHGLRLPDAGMGTEISGWENVEEYEIDMN
ncbi:DUF5119 domain-containing protein [Duncaniella freteri]|uniref:DUF5119 domain-containing protein n=2 Tax=Duncaniella TaxID=2518495 RepID=UPI00136A92E5|nr:DUF5119 domain-containing protein [Duncaniella freteri]MDE7027769.1 DUF5119 domain-containing protein [Duncaniella freteri]NBJ07697.1 DUF5119 domain-containing protein [Alistipes sp. Z76]NCE69768.1 DUF5119 domain-containing protein [Muribaculaceae bacterium M3]